MKSLKFFVAVFLQPVLKRPKAIKAQQKPVVKKQPQQAQRRDYGAPPPKPQIIIKQAGPSKQFGWVGHGTWVPKYSVPNAFADANLPQWNLMDGIFEAGLLYPGKEAAEAAPSYKAAPPPPPPKQPSYNEVKVRLTYQQNWPERLPAAMKNLYAPSTKNKKKQWCHFNLKSSSICSQNHCFFRWSLPTLSRLLQLLR